MLELRRLAQSVGRIAADRSQLRAAEDDLVAQHRQAAGGKGAHRGGGARRRRRGFLPYKGLASFEPPTRGYFFGRERFVAELVARVTGTAFLGIVGPSGSGKSSPLHAGLLAALTAGVLPGSEDWALAALASGRASAARARAGARPGA